MEASPPSARHAVREMGGFMADVRRSHQGHQGRPADEPQVRPQPKQGGWKVVTWRKKWHWVIQQPPPPPQPCHRVLTDLVQWVAASTA
jgi:hypothetical protein